MRTNNANGEADRDKDHGRFFTKVRPWENRTKPFSELCPQDAEAAKRICEALRRGGDEVRLDQSELRGGDVWTNGFASRSRLLPVHSNHFCKHGVAPMKVTSGSNGTYDQRTHKIARNRPFIVPVCLDATPDAGADAGVLSRVQWTRSTAGDTPVSVERVSQLLSPGEGLPVFRLRRPAWLASPHAAPVGAP